jgi:hypothetical protein
VKVYECLSIPYFLLIMPNRFYGIIILNEDDESIIGANVVRARDF